MDVCAGPRAENNSIHANITQIRLKMEAAAKKSGRKASDIILLAATKTRTAAEVRLAVEAGVDAVGENRVQELVAKHGEGAYEGVPLHFIGSLQTNKVKFLTGKVSVIHSVDSEKLGKMISSLSARAGITSDILLEINIGREELKSGAMPCRADCLCESLAALPGIRLKGLMAIPPVCAPEEGRRYFCEMREMFCRLKNRVPPGFDTLSMGMSEDYGIAIEEGSTIIRVGRGIFGQRRAANTAADFGQG